jgi:hypothetical protein
MALLVPTVLQERRLPELTFCAFRMVVRFARLAGPRYKMGVIKYESYVDTEPGAVATGSRINFGNGLCLLSKTVEASLSP